MCSLAVGMMTWRPSAGELVGVKKIDFKGIVIESKETPLASRIFGTFDGTACVLIEGNQQLYAWSDLYLIQDDDAVIGDDS
jgi:hypothetical protein